MLRRIFLIIVTAILLAIYVLFPIGLNIWAEENTNSFLGFQDNSRDISHFVSDMQKDNYTVQTIVTTPSIFEQNMIDSENTLYVAAGIEREYTLDEISAIKSFVKEGGHAIIADDFGYVSSLADAFNITYYDGQFFDQNYDKSTNFPICEAILGTDNGKWLLDPNLNAKQNAAGQRKIWSDEKDGIWDDDDDYDNLVDEDPLDDIDDDQDNRKLKRDGYDNDYNALVDETNEGIDEDVWDDDGDWIDENGNGRQDPYEIGVNEERLNGINDDARVHLFDYFADDDIIRLLDQGIFPNEIKNQFSSKLHLSLANETLIIEEKPNGQGWYLEDQKWKFEATEVDIPGQSQSKLEFWKLDDMIDEDLYHYRLIMNTPVAIYSFKTDTNTIARGSKNSYVDLNKNGEIELPDEDSTSLADRVSTGANRVELILEVVDSKFVGKGSIVFMPDADIFTNDLYSLNHMSIDYNDVFHNIIEESDIEPKDSLSEKDQKDINLIADNTPDNRTDYDNRIFMKDLVYYLFKNKIDSEEEDELLILIDDSRHGEDKKWLIPTYSTLKVTSVLTSESCYVVTSAIVLAVFIVFGILFSKGRENWEHKFNVRTFRQRRTLPTRIELKKRRLQEIVLDIARMNKGLSTEEFRAINDRDVDQLIGDPELIKLVRSEASYSEEEITRLIELVNKWKK